MNSIYVSDFSKYKSISNNNIRSPKAIPSTHPPPQATKTLLPSSPAPSLLPSHPPSSEQPHKAPIHPGPSRRIQSTRISPNNNLFAMADQSTGGELDETRQDPSVLNQTNVPHIPVDAPNCESPILVHSTAYTHPSRTLPATETPEKRRRGRPKGSKNKKTLEAMAGGLTTSSSSTAQPGEKRKRGRPPKVPYHLQFTDPSIIHDAIQSQEAADAASGKAPPKKRGRPRKNPEPQPADQSAVLVGSSGGTAVEGQGDEAGSLAKRMRSDGNE
jgi:hypothetical protein